MLKVNKYIITNFFEDARVMVIISVLVGISIEVALFKLNRDGRKLSLFIPPIIFLVFSASSFLLMLLPNGTLGVTQNFYFGCFMYSLLISLTSVVIGLYMFLHSFK